MIDYILIYWAVASFFVALYISLFYIEVYNDIYSEFEYEENPYGIDVSINAVILLRILFAPINLSLYLLFKLFGKV